MTDEPDKLVEEPNSRDAKTQPFVDSERDEEYQRKFGMSFFDTARVMDALRNATPSFITRLREQEPERQLIDKRFRADFEDSPIIRHPVPPPFPQSESVAQQNISSVSIPDITFIVSDATNAVDGEPNNRVLVADGKINGEFPAGMGFGDYILDLADPSDSLIYAGLTFNPTTLAITSRFLGVSGSGDFPESRVESPTDGFLYWLLAFTFFDGDGRFRVINRRVGDINFEFTYGAFSGARALLPVHSDPGWIDLEAAFP